MALVKSNMQRYEYRIITVNDNIGGGTDISSIEKSIQTYAAEGWRVVTVFTNELGKNALSIGGVGINSTVDQSIIVFERPVKQQDDLVHRAVVEIQCSNILTPFVPKSISLFETKGVQYAVLKVFCIKNFALKGLQCNLTVSNLFEDSVVLDDVCFFSFTQNQDGYYESTPYPVSLPNKINYGISAAGISITRYIGNEGLVVVDDTHMQSIVEVQANKIPDFNKDVFFMEVNSLKNASEVYQYVFQVFGNNSEVFSEELLHELRKVADIERFYGNSKATAQKMLEQYLDTFLAEN